MIRSIRRKRIFDAGASGAIGGAITGYLGIEAFSPVNWTEKALLGASIGAAVALGALVVILIVGRKNWREALRNTWWIYPATIALTIVVCCGNELTGWVFGGIVGQLKGWSAIMFGGVLGALVFGGLEFIRTRNRSLPTTPGEQIVANPKECQSIDPPRPPAGV